MPPVIAPFKSANPHDQNDADQIVTNLSVRVYDVVYAVTGGSERRTSSVYLAPARWLEPGSAGTATLWALTRSEARILMLSVGAQLAAQGRGDDVTLSVRGRWVSYADLSTACRRRVRELTEARRVDRGAARRSPEPKWVH